MNCSLAVSFCAANVTSNEDSSGTDGVVVTMRNKRRQDSPCVSANLDRLTISFVI